MSLINIDALNSHKDREKLGGELQAAYRGAWNMLKQEHEQGLDSLEVVAQLTRLMDSIIGLVFNRTVKELEREGITAEGPLAMLALGSYGRRELAPHSDVDLLFLVPEKITPWVKELTERVLYLLWDTGLDVGYSTRSSKDCYQLAQENYDVLTSILDARFLEGNPDFLTGFREEFRGKVLDKVASDFIRAKLEVMEERLARHGGTVYVLEPNLKEGMGGLRDIHTALWVAKVLFNVDSFQDLARSGEMEIVDKGDLKTLSASLEFLQQVRCELHFTSNAARDLLTMERQPFIAEKLGYRDRKSAPAVEQFMQDYYGHTGQVHHLTESIIKRSMEFKRRTPAILRMFRERDLGEGFYSLEGTLLTRENPSDLFQREPERMMEVFERFQMSNLDVAPEISQAIRKNLKLVNHGFRKSRQVKESFFRILAHDRRLYETLLLMNELRFLGKFIPEFGTIHCKMQHDYYHTYTVDEHSIRAIREIVELPEGSDPSMALYREVFQEVADDKVLLILTILLHDVGKGKGSNHSVKGAEMAGKAGRRLGLSREQVETMTFLIEQHLLMSHVAQRRDLHEERTILETAKTIGDPETLRLLYLLTMADLKAVGPTVWNDWKASLISELFVETNRVMAEGGFDREQLLERMLVSRAFIEQSLIKKGHGETAIRQEMDILTERAYLVSRPSVIRRLLDMKLKMGQKPIVTSWRQAREGGHTNLFIVAKDHVGLFARVAGVLAANNINILGAQIHTRPDGTVFDVLHVTDNLMRPVTDRVKYKLVRRELEKVVSGELSVEELIGSRQLSLPLGVRDRVITPVPTRVDINNDISDEHTVIDIYTTDRIGLLYRITSALASLGLSIFTAKVSTKVDQAVDVFYVKDGDGNKITDEGTLEQVRERLIEAAGGDQD
jgi:[protein-PII] uridylyltransferase